MPLSEEEFKKQMAELDRISSETISADEAKRRATPKMIDISSPKAVATAAASGADQFALGAGSRLFPEQMKKIRERNPEAAAFGDIASLPLSMLAYSPEGAIANLTSKGLRAAAPSSTSGLRLMPQIVKDTAQGFVEGGASGAAEGLARQAVSGELDIEGLEDTAKTTGIIGSLLYGGGRGLMRRLQGARRGSFDAGFPESADNPAYVAGEREAVDRGMKTRRFDPEARSSSTTDALTKEKLFGSRGRIAVQADRRLQKVEDQLDDVLSKQFKSEPFIQGDSLAEELLDSPAVSRTMSRLDNAQLEGAAKRYSDQMRRLIRKHLTVDPKFGAPVKVDIKTGIGPSRQVTGPDSPELIQQNLPARISEPAAQSRTKVIGRKETPPTLEPAELSAFDLNRKKRQVREALNDRDFDAENLGPEKLAIRDFSQFLRQKIESMVDEAASSGRIAPRYVGKVKELNNRSGAIIDFLNNRLSKPVPVDIRSTIGAGVTGTAIGGTLGAQTGSPTAGALGGLLGMGTLTAMDLARKTPTGASGISSGLQIIEDLARLGEKQTGTKNIDRIMRLLAAKQARLQSGGEE